MISQLMRMSETTHADQAVVRKAPHHCQLSAKSVKDISKIF
jgi:hypothetical protein